MLRSISTILGILRSANNSKDRMKSVKSYPMKKFEGLTIFEKEYIYSISDFDISTLLNLIFFSDSIISEILREIIRKSFSLYSFFSR